MAEVRGNPPSLVDSPHKGRMKREVSSCYSVLTNHAQSILTPILHEDGIPVASFTTEVNSRLAKRPLDSNGRLANRWLTSLVKEATGELLRHYCPFYTGDFNSMCNICLISLCGCRFISKATRVHILLPARILNPCVEATLNNAACKTLPGLNEGNPGPGHIYYQETDSPEWTEIEN